MNRDSQYLRHWAAMARLTEEQSSLLTADTLEALAGKFEALEAEIKAIERSRDALADELSKRPEPAVYEAEMNGFMSSVTKSHYEECKRYGVKTRVLYTAPPAPVAHQVQQLRSALIDALAWIDAVPRDTMLPTMPGFDRDDVDNLVDETALPAPEMPFTYAELKDMHGDKFARGYECGWKRRGESEDMRRSHKTTPATDNTEAQYESLKRGKTS